MICWCVGKFAVGTPSYIGGPLLLSVCSADGIGGYSIILLLAAAWPAVAETTAWFGETEESPNI